jgi:hypothetical protein
MYTCILLPDDFWIEQNFRGTESFRTQLQALLSSNRNKGILHTYLDNIAVRQSEFLIPTQGVFLLLHRVQRDITAFFFDCPHNFSLCRCVQMMAGFAKEELEIVGYVSTVRYK